jgi:hypothetical protein
MFHFHSGRKLVPHKGGTQTVRPAIRDVTFSRVPVEECTRVATKPCLKSRLAKSSSGVSFIYKACMEHTTECHKLRDETEQNVSIPIPC